MTTPRIVPAVDEVLAAWQARVVANREQVARVRAGPEREDFYAPVARQFAGDPQAEDDPVLRLLRTLVRAGEAVLDIGAGGGRYALPLSRLASEVIAVEPSPAMRQVLREGVERHRVNNLRVVEASWPMPTPAPEADVALMSHVGYDIEEIGPFLDAAERSARRLCIVVLASTAPSDLFAPFWEAAHGEPRATLPALREFLVLLLARGLTFEVRMTERPPVVYPDLEAALAAARFRTWVTPGSASDERLTREVRRRAVPQGNGVVLDERPLPIGVVSWSPAPRG